MKYFKFILILLSVQLYSQNTNTDSIFVMLDESKFGDLVKTETNKNNDLVKIKILHFDKQKEGFKNKKLIKNDNEIVVVNSQPNNNFYEFNGNIPPIKIKDISGLEIYSIRDLSKNDERVWKKFPYKMFFIEKIKCENYNIWEMTPVFRE